MSATFVCPVVLSTGVQETIEGVTIARVEGCNSNPRDYRSRGLRCHGSCRYGREKWLGVDASDWEPG